jgi:hypothetical protein
VRPEQPPNFHSVPLLPPIARGTALGRGTIVGVDGNVQDCMWWLAVLVVELLVSNLSRWRDRPESEKRF